MMSSDNKNELPQEGTNLNVGESLFEHSSSCPTDSGGDKNSNTAHRKVTIRGSLLTPPIASEAIPKTLYDTLYEDLVKTCTNQQQTIRDLNSRIAELETRSTTLSSNQNRPTSSQNAINNGSSWMLQQLPAYQHENIYNALSQDEYLTDEEELNKEFQHLDNKNNKKRRRTATKSPPKNTVKSGNNNTEPKIPKIPLPPPINVSNISNFEIFRKKILETTKELTNFKALSNSDVKITVQNEDDYRNVKKLLEKFKNESSTQLENIEYHTYQLKSEKSYRTVVRGLPSSISHDEIKEDLEKLGHEVVGVTNIFKMVTIDGVKVRKAFPLFYIDLKQKDNNKEVFNIRNLAYCTVKIEPPKKTRGIPQCTNCQQLGHTKSFCHRQNKCVKCAENHHTKQCKKQPGSPPTCALCQQKGHTANYKGCPVYQNKIKSQQKYKASAVQRLQTKSVRPKTTNTPATVGLSYAQVIQISDDKLNQDNKHIEINNEPNNNVIIKMLSQIQQTLGQLAERVAKLENNSKPPSKKVNKNKNG